MVEQIAEDKEILLLQRTGDHRLMMVKGVEQLEDCKLIRGWKKRDEKEVGIFVFVWREV